MFDKSIPHINVIMCKKEPENFPAFSLPEGYSFRPYSPGDEAEWVDIMMSVGFFSSTDKGRDVFLRDFCRDEKALKQRCFFVVDKNGSCVATATLWQGNLFGDVRQKIHWVAVRPEYSNNGLAKAILTRLLELYKALNCTGAVYLESQTWSYKAINIYMEFGFEPYLGEMPVNWTAENYKKTNLYAWELIFDKINVYKASK